MKSVHILRFHGGCANAMAGYGNVFLEIFDEFFGTEAAYLVVRLENYANELCFYE